MKANNENRTMNAKQNRGDFKTQWKRRKQDWQTQVAKTMPDDATILRIADRARAQTPAFEENIISITRKPARRWMPYAAAASIAIGVTVIGLTRQSGNDNGMPVAKEVNVEGQTVRFLCNNDCSVNDVLLSVNEVIKN